MEGSSRTVEDYEPPKWYFRFNPDPSTGVAGVVSTPLMGDVEPGRAYETTDEQRAAILRDHPEWTEIQQSTYNKQIRADAAESKEQ